MFNAAGWFLPLLVAVVATPLLLRELGPARYGVWAICVVLAALVPMLDLGFGTAAVRELASSRDDLPRQRRVTAELVTLMLAQGAFTWTVLALGADAVAGWLNFEQAVEASRGRALIMLLGAWTAVSFLNNALMALPRAHERFGALAILTTLGSLGLWIGTTLLALGGADLPLLLLYGILLQLLTAGALVVVHRHIAGSWPRPALKLAVLPKHSRFAMASFLASLASIATYHADKALISAFIGPAAAGLYTTVANVASKLLGLTAAFGGVLFPRISMIHSEGNVDQVERLYHGYHRTLMGLSIVLGATGIVLAERFLTLWLGKNSSADLVLAFRLLIVAYVVASTSVVASNVLSGRGNAHRGAWFAGLGGLMTVVACLLLIPRMGLVGAGVAAIIGMSQALAFDFWARLELNAGPTASGRAKRLPWTGWLLAAGAAAAVAWISASFLSGWGGFLASGVAAVAAALALWFAGGFASAEERDIATRCLQAMVKAKDD